MAVPAVTPDARRDGGAAFFIAAVISGAIPALAVVVDSGLAVAGFRTPDTLILIFLVTAILALVLALAGLYLVWPYGPARVLLATVPLFLLNLHAAVSMIPLFGSYSVPCSTRGGWCFDDNVLCLGGFLLDLVAAVLVIVGVPRLRQCPGPAAILSPAWPPR